MPSMTLIVAQKYIYHWWETLSSTHFQCDDHLFLLLTLWPFNRTRKTLMAERSHPLLLWRFCLTSRERVRLNPHQNLFNPLASSALPFFSRVSNLCQNPLGRGERGGSPRAGWLHGRNHGEGKRPQGEGGGNCSCGRRGQPSGQSA